MLSHLADGTRGLGRAPTPGWPGALGWGSPRDTIKSVPLRTGQTHLSSYPFLVFSVDPSEDRGCTPAKLVLPTHPSGQATDHLLLEAFQAQSSLNLHFMALPV